MKMNKYECHCSDTDCILQSNKRPTFCPNFSHSNPDWKLVNAEISNSENATVKVKERWKPQRGEKYFCIDTLFVKIVCAINCNEHENIWHYDIGNCFKTKEEAEKVLKKIQELLLSWKGENEK